MSTLATTATERPSRPAPAGEVDPPGSPPGARIRSRKAAAAVAVAAGGLIALSMPPFGWWPLAFAGVALWDRLLAGARLRQRLARSYLLAVIWYVPTITWSWDLTPPGYVLAVAGMSVYLALAGAVTPPGAFRRLVFPAAVVLAQHLVGIFPWGGIPVAHLAISQAGSCAAPCAQLDSPLIHAARIGGPLLVMGLVVIGGQSLAALADVVPRLLRQRGSAAGTGPPRLPPIDRHDTRAAAVGLMIVAAVTIAGALAPRGHDVAPLRVAVVQGGGPQRTSASDGDAAQVFLRHLDATRRLVTEPVDVVLWPENIVAVDGSLAGSGYEPILAELARELDATVIVGVTEDAVGEPAFYNASIAIGPDGRIGDRYDKVHRVPFGEWVPHRPLVERLVTPETGLPSRDAVAGTGTGVLRTEEGSFGIVISFEDFFDGRARDAIGNGGEVLMNPTNGASYWLTQVQTQQIASSRLRAVETGRWHLQSAPTGFSSVITPDGDLLARTDVSEQAVHLWGVQRRAGHTLFTRVGPGPVLALCILAVAGGWVLARRRRPS